MVAQEAVAGSKCFAKQNLEAYTNHLFSLWINQSSSKRASESFFLLPHCMLPYPTYIVSPAPRGAGRPDLGRSTRMKWNTSPFLM